MSRLPLAVLLCGALIACPRAPATTDARQANDDQVAVRCEIGYLGANGHGTLRTLEIKDDKDVVQRPGGFVLREVSAGGPLAKLGLQPGDIIVRVLDDFLPNKENPTLDLLARIEQAYTAGKNEIAIGYLRGDTQRHATLVLDPRTLPPLNQGRLDYQARYPIVAAQGLAFLQKAQRADGGFAVARASPDAELAVTSLAGLAFLAGKDEASQKCVGFALKALDDEKVTHLGAAFATLLLAEVAQHSEDQRTAVMPALTKAVECVVKAQREDGGFALGESEPGYNESTLAAHGCVQALGAAERAGATVDNAVFERAFTFFKKHTNDGKVGFVPEASFDRRSEAGRLAGILVAMRGAGCDFTDAYMGKLFDYYSHQSKEIAYAPVDEALPLLASALLMRQKGLPQWILFNYENQILLLSLQKPDGSFAEIAKARKPIAFFDDCAGPAWRTAIYSLVLLLQEDTLPILSPKPSTTFAKSRDASGKVSEHAAAPPEAKAPSGAMQFTSIEDAIEMMKKMGVKDDDPQMKQLLDLQKKAKKD